VDHEGKQSTRVEFTDIIGVAFEEIELEITNEFKRGSNDKKHGTNIYPWINLLVAVEGLAEKVDPQPIQHIIPGKQRHKPRKAFAGKNPRPVHLFEGGQKQTSQKYYGWTIIKYIGQLVETFNEEEQENRSDNWISYTNYSKNQPWRDLVGIVSPLNVILDHCCTLL
jgi:hypothetical protein